MPLSIECLTVVRGSKMVIDGLSLRVGAGEAIAVTGPNGAGKTTLLRAIAGFLAPQHGRVQLTLESGADDGPVADRCHFIGHLDGIKASLTVAENAQFWAAYLGGCRARQESTGTMLDRVGIGNLAPVTARLLSAGQRRRAALARLLLAPRPLWLLDEPTTSLDADGQAMLGDIASEHLAAGGMIVAATHSPLPFAGTPIQLGNRASTSGRA